MGCKARYASLSSSTSNAESLNIAANRSSLSRFASAPSSPSLSSSFRRAFFRDPDPLSFGSVAWIVSSLAASAAFTLGAFFFTVILVARSAASLSSTFFALYSSYENGSAIALALPYRRLSTKKPCMYARSTEVPMRWLIPSRSSSSRVTNR